MVAIATELNSYNQEANATQVFSDDAGHSLA